MSREVRELPDGLERVALQRPPVSGELQSVTVVAFRTGRNRKWLAATAGSVHIVDGKRLAGWAVVEGDPLT